LPSEITAISGSIVNCYLVKTGTGFILIDTGVYFQRGALKRALKSADCQPGNLKLIIITHGDFDHTGNCAWLCKTYGTKIAMHRSEAGAAEKGDMHANRKTRRGIIAKMIFSVLSLFFFRGCKADIYLEDGEDLSAYGWGAHILHLPGHSLGSIGILTNDGDFFCGDTLENYKQPVKASRVDDEVELNASIERVKNLTIKKVYPGHGKPFTMETFLNSNP